tara:strand:+ start:111 stop:1337 length:1227 start_codon:yes stop_codon:yes gene_type:complete
MNNNTNKFLSLCEENDYNSVLNFYNNNAKINLRYNNEEAFKIMCLRGNIDLIKWVLKVEPNINIFIDNNECFNILCKNGHYKTFIWLYIKYCNEKSINNIYLLFIETCKGGNIKLVKYVFSIFRDNIKNRMKEILNFICRYGNIEMLKYIISQIDDLNRFNQETLLESAYLSEDLEMIKYLTGLFDDKNDYYITFFDLVIYISNIEIIKWFINRYNINDLTIKDNAIFFNLLENEKFEGLEYFILNYQNVIDKINNNINQKSKLDNFVLNSNSIKVQHLKLLLENFNIDLTGRDHLFFRNNCYSANIKILEFLNSRYPNKYYFKYINNEITDWYINREVKIVEDKLVDEIDICPICLDSKSDIISKCSHQFCIDCITTIFSKSRNFTICPICRSSVKEFNSLIKYIII